MQIIALLKTQVGDKLNLIVNSFCAWSCYQGSLCWRMGLPAFRHVKISTYDPEWGVTLDENPRLEKQPQPERQRCSPQDGYPPAKGRGHLHRPGADGAMVDAGEEQEAGGAGWLANLPGSRCGGRPRGRCSDGVLRLWRMRRATWWMSTLSSSGNSEQSWAPISGWIS